MGWDDVSELRLPMGLFFIPYVICEYGESEEWQWQGKSKNSNKNLSLCHFVHLKFHMDKPVREPGPRQWYYLLR
jgi:hypothetical protein